MVECIGRLKLGLIATIALVTIAFASGCAGGSDSREGRACTLIGCESGLALQFSKPLREAGSYTVSVELDGELTSCQTALPFASCAGGRACASPQVLLEQSGCALPPSAHEIVGLRVTSVARAVRIRIERDGAEIASQEFTPSYVRSQPNGEGCGPICEQASATLTVP
jgi:hypothetical protein